MEFSGIIQLNVNNMIVALAAVLAMLISISGMACNFLARQHFTAGNGTLTTQVRSSAHIVFA
jgi:hypothetical protein